MTTGARLRDGRLDDVREITTVRLPHERGRRWALTTQTMTDEQRKSVAIEYLKAFDNGGTTSSGGSILDLFAEDAQAYFPKWGLANGKEQIGQVVR